MPPLHILILSCQQELHRKVLSFLLVSLIINIIVWCWCLCCFPQSKLWWYGRGVMLKLELEGGYWFYLFGWWGMGNLVWVYYVFTYIREESCYKKAIDKLILRVVLPAKRWGAFDGWRRSKSGYGECKIGAKPAACRYFIQVDLWIINMKVLMIKFETNYNMEVQWMPVQMVHHITV